MAAATVLMENRFYGMEKFLSAYWRGDAEQEE